MTKSEFIQICRKHDFPERLINVLWDRRVRTMSKEEVETRVLEVKEGLGPEIEALREIYKKEELLKNINDANSFTN